MQPLGIHEGPAAYVRRTGLGVDRAWKVWNAYQDSRGYPGMSRTQFRAAARQVK